MSSIWKLPHDTIVKPFYRVLKLNRKAPDLKANCEIAAPSSVPGL